MGPRGDEASGELPPVTAGGLDPSALERMFVECGPHLRRYVLAVVKDPEVAADVVQATFARALEAGPSSQVGNLKAWLYRVAWNEALLIRRKAGVRQRAGARLAAMFGRRSMRPEESLIRRETVERVRKNLEVLSEEEQVVVRARIYEDRTFQQIADDQGVPLGTVLSRMRRALGKLQRGLEPGEGQ